MTDIAFRPAFDLVDDAAYARWRLQKRQSGVPDLEQLRVTIEDPFALRSYEIAAIRAHCDQYNMAIYQLADASQYDKGLVVALGKAVGLYRLDANLRSDEDSVSTIEVRQQQGNSYIPYTNKPLSWHTDGYYNRLDRQVNAIVMHCLQPAGSGGENHLLDHECVYMRLRDENPAYIKALMHPRAMTIPANVENGVELRAEQAGPVFTVHPHSGRLHMRYSARKRNIIWRNDTATLEAAEMIGRLLADNEAVISVHLQAGQGIICNNVLHNRSAFVDSQGLKRRLLRARYYDRVL